ncbi:MAG: response regulator [bacterium]
MTVNISAYKSLYLETARKLIAEYVHVTSSPDAEHTLQNLLRIFHSLKGQSMAMGYKNIATLALQVELFCRTSNDNKISLSAASKESLPSPKVLYDDLNYIEKTNEEISLTKEIETVKNLIEGNKHKQLYLLLVEDDLFFQKICIDKFRERSIRVDFSDNGEDAIARMAIKKYDCILLDIIMPKKNGFDVLQFAKENNIIPQTPIIVLSTLGQEDDIKKALAMGAVDFINKGNLDIDLLMSKIESVINKNKK